MSKESFSKTLSEQKANEQQLRQTQLREMAEANERNKREASEVARRDSETETKSAQAAKQAASQYGHEIVNRLEILNREKFDGKGRIEKTGDASWTLRTSDSTKRESVTSQVGFGKGGRTEKIVTGQEDVRRDYGIEVGVSLQIKDSGHNGQPVIVEANSFYVSAEGVGLGAHASTPLNLENLEEVLVSAEPKVLKEERSNKK